MPALVSLDRFSVSFTGNLKVLKNITWQVKPGEWWGIGGSNGSGKTTLLYSLAGLIPKEIPARTAGKIKAARPVGMVFQNPDFSLFNLTVAEEVAFGHHRPIGPALQAVGLSRYRRRDPQTLSYGAKQKLCLAAVLAKDPPLILLDEPASMLDYAATISLYEILARLHRRGKTIIVVDHHTELLARYTQKILLLDRGCQAAAGISQKILANRSLIRRLKLKPL